MSGFSSLLRFRLRLIAAVLALVSIGLFASLLPRTSFIPRSSGEVVDAIGPVWPGQSVEQALDDVDVISEVRIWAAAGFDRGEAPVVASLLQAQAEEPVRQVKIAITARKLPAPYVLVFPPYQPAPDEKLVLQLWVSTEREQEREHDNHVMFGANNPGENTTAATLNRQPTDHGSIAYEVIWRGTGWRAALEGSIPDLARLAGAIAAALTAVALRPSISQILRKTARRVHIALLKLASPIRGALRRATISRISQLPDAEAPSKRRSFYLFPWLIPVFAILHYLAHNLALFRIADSIAILVVVSAIVTVVFVAFRLFFKTAAVAAVLTGLLGIAFFSYGHIYIAVGEHADHRYLVGLGVPIMFGLGKLVRGRSELPRKLGTILNVGSLVLLAAPVYQIAFDSYAASSAQLNQDSQGLATAEEGVAEAKARLTRNELRDIYYIVLDEYPRSGSPPEFDNSEFVQELESRGFYVAPQAHSNYVYTQLSLPSSLNMRYFSEDNEPDEQETNQLREQRVNHKLGRILKTLGYNYVHVSSGWSFTDTNRNADLVVDFSPSGPILSGPETRDRFSFETVSRLSTRFTTTLLRTTAASPFPVA